MMSKIKKPPGWELYVKRSDGMMWVNRSRQLSVIESTNREKDGKNWRHLSIAHPRRMPTYDELTYLKRHWAGEDAKAIMVFPAKAEHVNIHPNCLHLFVCLDGDPLPDFTQGTGSI